jgi:hypothetical protein
MLLTVRLPRLSWGWFMRCIGTLAFGVTALGALLGLSVLAKADILVSISKAQQQMTVSIDGARTYRWAVSTGRSGYDTPSGGFRAIRLEQVYYSKKFDDAPMPNSVFFYGGYAIHGTYEESKLGNPVSHGCVRLARGNAEILYALVRARGMSNTRVVITDGPVRDSSPVPMARQRDPGFQQLGGGFPNANRRVGQYQSRQRSELSRARPHPDETRSSSNREKPRFVGGGDDVSREAWLRSLDRKYGVNTR